MADISNVITVTLLEEPSLAARDNLNVVGIITSETGVLSTAERYRVYRNLADVATDWGVSSQVYDHASAFFATSPNPIGAGGVLVVGWWRAAEETVAATAATLTGGELSEAVVIPQVQSISDAAFDITIDGVEENITALDLRTVTTLTELATAIDGELTGADCALSDDNELVITSKTTGATSTITVISDPGTGTFIGSICALSAGTGAVAVQGAAAGVNALETKVTCITEIKAQTNLYGAVFIDEPTSQEAQDLATFAQANDMLIYDVFDSASNLEIDVTNPVWLIKLAGNTNYRMMYSAAGNRKMATSYMARMHTVNFSAINSAIDMHLKTLSVPAETHSETVISKAKKVGLAIYDSIKLTPCVLEPDATVHSTTDNRYNLLGYKDAIETDLFNLLRSTTTKIPQTISGINQIIDQCEKTTIGFVKCGVFARGSWSSPDYFGNYETFVRNISENGFYFLAGSLSGQSQADRAARKSPVIQGAVKNAGAIRSADIIINFNL